jgi:hypothetical protein
MIEIWRVKGGLTALRVGVGDFALNPQEKNNFVEKAYFKLYKMVLVNLELIISLLFNSCFCRARPGSNVKDNGKGGAFSLHLFMIFVDRWSFWQKNRA